MVLKWYRSTSRLYGCISIPSSWWWLWVYNYCYFACQWVHCSFVSQLFISEGTSYRGSVGLLLMFSCYINVNCCSDLRCFLLFVSFPENIQGFQEETCRSQLTLFGEVRWINNGIILYAEVREPFVEGCRRICSLKCVIE